MDLVNRSTRQDSKPVFIRFSTPTMKELERLSEVLNIGVATVVREIVEQAIRDGINVHDQGTTPTVSRRRTKVTSIGGNTPAGR
jgi:hypothetical protein